MLKTLGCTHVLCGHSERRRYHGETDDMIAAQVSAALALGIIPVLCIGENADEQKLKTTEHVLKHQLSSVIGSQSSQLTAQSFLIAYEPVWAIGTGTTPTPKDVQTVHAFIRSLLPNPKTRIIYGGSVTGQNAAEFFRQPDIDGVLVGGASLKPQEFAAIVAATNK